MRYIFLIQFFILCTISCVAQQGVKGIVVDAETRKALPFATIKQGDTKQGLVTDINGRFSFNLLDGVRELRVSYLGYKTATISVDGIDTVFLTPLANEVNEVVIRPPYEKIRRIVNTAIANKSLHAPESYDWYQCNIYYKWKADLLPNIRTIDDSELNRFTENSHMAFSETYSTRTYSKPQKLHEEILASRVSGLKKTHFASQVTDLIPFDVYGDFIKLNEKDYLHPISSGWQQRYEFGLVDEFVVGEDTVYILSYKPKKNVSFNSLKGSVYIHTNGFAIANIIATTEDTSSERYVKMEQVYRNINGKWFPRELNYNLVFKKWPSEELGLKVTGHSVIDSVSFVRKKEFHFDKTHPVTINDSVDLRSAEQWSAYRFDTISRKEVNTYHVMDSIMGKYNIDKVFLAAGKAGSGGMVPIGPVDIDLKRLLSLNAYENIRLGLGLYTNDEISKYFAVGGWFGYGFKDKEWKYGANLRIYPNGTKDHWLDAFYQRNYQNTGNINFNRELDRNALKQWLLSQVDQVEEIGVTGHIRAGYWELEGQGKHQLLTPQYLYSFNEAGSTGNFDVREVSLGVRYAFREKRVPAFGFYATQKTKYPIAYLKFSVGDITSGSYYTKYWRALAAVTYDVHINRWGTDNFRLEGGMISSADDKPLPRSFLLAGNGFRMTQWYQWYAWGGFITMLPYEYFSDEYVSLLYRHDFDKRLYKNKYSNPYISIAHNMMYGALNQRNTTADAGIKAPYKGYHESGIILNRLVSLDYMGLCNFNVNVGGFYHWNSEFDPKNQGRLALGLSLDL